MKFSCKTEESSCETPKFSRKTEESSCDKLRKVFEKTRETYHAKAIEVLVEN